MRSSVSSGGTNGGASTFASRMSISRLISRPVYLADRCLFSRVAAQQVPAVPLKIEKHSKAAVWFIARL